MAGENSNLVTLRVAQIADIEIRSIGIAKPWRAVIAAACRQDRGVEAAHLFLIIGLECNRAAIFECCRGPVKREI